MISLITSSTTDPVYTINYDRKKYNEINNPILATPLHRQNENYWIRELGTATPYGCNHKIDGIDRVRC
jgi:hypothetical protein